jgi:hypothetical protein
MPEVTLAEMIVEDCFTMNPTVTVRQVMKKHNVEWLPKNSEFWTLGPKTVGDSFGAFQSMEVSSESSDGVSRTFHKLRSSPYTFLAEKGRMVKKNGSV